MTLANFSSLVAQSGAQKRAISYAETIMKLFDSVMTDKQPADRVIAHYFKEHKKHGSKDRRVIRESLFSLFRWWGWLQQLGSYENAQTSFNMLYAAASLDGHEWAGINQAWAELGNNLKIAHDSESPAPSTLADKAAFFAVLTGKKVTLAQLLPGWFWQHCGSGDDSTTTSLDALVEVMCTRPPIWARAQNKPRADIINMLRAQDVEVHASPFFSDAINLGSKSINLNQVEAYTQGFVEIQDLASQVIGQICAPASNSNWWDACSGAGGKTLQLMSLAQQNYGANNGVAITASDIRKHALNELLKRAKRANIAKISVAPWLTDELPVPHQAFDGVLVDAPCSCTGTWRRNPDMRWIDDESAITNKPSLQLDILSRSSQAVKQGGELVYATCSLAKAENDDVVNAFLATHPEFTLEEITHPFTGEVTSMLTVWPQQADSDGMFVAKMRRK